MMNFASCLRRHRARVVSTFCAKGIRTFEAQFVQSRHKSLAAESRDEPRAHILFYYMARVRYCKCTGNRRMRLTRCVCNIRSAASVNAGVKFELLHASRVWLHLGQVVSCLIWESQGSKCTCVGNACVADDKQY